MSKLILGLDKQSQLVIDLPDLLKDLAEWTYVKIFFKERSKKYVLYVHDAGDALRNICGALRMVVKGRGELPSEIASYDIGYLSNQYFNRPQDLKKDVNCNFEHILRVWSSGGGQPRLETSFYNDSEGNIVLHISEQYYWFMLDKNEGKNYIPYSKFIKNYKPTLIRIVPHQVARKWLAQCEYSLALAEFNNPQFIKEKGLQTFTLAELASSFVD